MKKKIIIIAIFLLIAGVLLALELRKVDFGTSEGAKSLSASIIRQTEQKQEPEIIIQEKKDITKESLEALGLGDVEVVEEGMTDLLLEEVMIHPLLMRKQNVKIGDIAFMLNILENINDYPVILTESYVQEGDKYRVSEIAKDAFIIHSEREKDKIRFVSEGKNTIIGLLFEAKDIDIIKKILEKHNFETP